MKFLHYSHLNYYYNTLDIGTFKINYLWIFEPSFLFKESNAINFSEVRFLEYPRRIRQIGHVINLGLHLQQIKWPLSHWKTGLVFGMSRQTGHSRCPLIVTLKLVSFDFWSSMDVFWKNIKFYQPFQISIAYVQLYNEKSSCSFIQLGK